MRKRCVILLLALGILFPAALSRLDRSRREEGRQHLETALRRSAVSCYALEGFYPPDVAYLQDHYGLQFDADAYIIHYTRTASNWMPEITVLEKMP